MPINQFNNTNNSSDVNSGSVDDLEDFDLEVEGEDEEVTGEPSVTDPYGPDGHYTNLTYLFDDEELKVIGRKVCGWVKEDEDSRQVWINHAITGLKLLGLNLDNAEQAVVVGGCTATHPLILETAVKFQSKASTELLPANGPANVLIKGKKTDEKIARAGRVKQHLNYQLTEQMPEFYTDSEKMYLYSAIFGEGFKKNWYSPDKRRPISEFVPADLFVVSNNATDLESAERYTYVQPISERTMRNRMASGFYKKYEVLDTDDLTGMVGANIDTTQISANALKPYDIDLGEFSEEFNAIVGVQSGQTGEGFKIYEHYCYYDFKNKKELRDPNGRQLPYIITVDSESSTVLSIRRNWSEEDIINKEREEYFTKYGYIPSFGFYSFGLIHLLGNVQLVMTSLMRSLVDSGQFANMQGGYKAKGPRITGATDTFAMGEFRDIEVPPGVDIRSILLPHQFKEPSAVVQAMLQYLDNRGSEFANATDAVLSGSSNYGPVGTTMALLEAAGKLYAAIYKRYHKAQGKELKIIARLNHEFMDDEEGYPFDPTNVEGEDAGAVYRRDYDPKGMSIVPVSDPNVSSQAHRIAISNAKLDAAIQAKGIAPELAINFPKILKGMFIDLDPQEDINDLIIPQEEAQPLDPLSDIKILLDGKPIKAFEGQDHQAHIQFKTAWLEDPDQGGSKAMQQFQPQVVANIREHMIMGYQEKIGAMVTGAATDGQTQEMLMAQAAQELARMSELMKTQDTPENKVADAVKLEAEVKRDRLDMEKQDNEFDKLMKLVQTVIAASREQNRAAESESKVDTEQLAMLKDFLLKGEELNIKKQAAKSKKPTK